MVYHFYCLVPPPYSDWLWGPPSLLFH